MGIGIAITFVWCIQNILQIDHQGWANNGAALLQILSVVVITIVLFATSPQATTQYVFFTIRNDTGFPLGYVFVIGILATAFSFAGYEGRRMKPAYRRE